MRSSQFSSVPFLCIYPLLHIGTCYTYDVSDHKLICVCFGKCGMCWPDWGRSQSSRRFSLKDAWLSSCDFVFVLYFVFSKKRDQAPVSFTLVLSIPVSTCDSTYYIVLGQIHSKSGSMKSANGKKHKKLPLPRSQRLNLSSRRILMFSEKFSPN